MGDHITPLTIWIHKPKLFVSGMWEEVKVPVQTQALSAVRLHSDNNSNVVTLQMTRFFSSVSIHCVGH